VTHLSIRNWEKFQHYKDRNPPWIKLHFELLTSEDWVVLDDASRVLAVACMLVASRNEGQVRVDRVGQAYIERLAFLNSPPDFKPLIDSGFLVGDSAMLADASKILNSVRPEEETETETEKEKPIGQTAPDRFDDFWLTYPKKVKKAEARKKWKARKLDLKADEIIADVQARTARDGRWLEGYVPDPTTYINGSRWDDEIEPPRGKLQASSVPHWMEGGA